jgi:biopolymer transport protein TolQ
VDQLERNLELLANIGSTAPYVGLVGTVFGIMVTMHDMISSGAQAGIAAVAPGISEALFATAIGLFVAIPAVWAYNRFTTRVERMSVRYEDLRRRVQLHPAAPERWRQLSGATPCPPPFRAAASAAS